VSLGLTGEKLGDASDKVDVFGDVVGDGDNAVSSNEGTSAGVLVCLELSGKDLLGGLDIDGTLDVIETTNDLDVVRSQPREDGLEGRLGRSDELVDLLHSHELSIVLVVGIADGIESLAQNIQVLLF